MILSSFLFLAALVAPVLQDGDEGPPTDPAEALRAARRGYAKEEGAPQRKEALRTMAQVALDSSSRLVSEARRGLLEGLDDRDLSVAGEAIRLVVLADEPAVAERELSSRLKDSVRTLRRFMAEVDHRKKTRSLGFLAGFPELEEQSRLKGYPGHVEALARSLAEVPGDRAVDALVELLELDLAAQSGPLVLAATDSLLKQEPAPALQAIVDWALSHRKELTASPVLEDRKERKAQLRALQDERFGRLNGLRGFRDAFPPVDASSYAEVFRRLEEWAKAQQLPDPPLEGEAADWKAWLKEVRTAGG